MKIRMTHTGIGSGFLTDEQQASNGQPVFVADDGRVFGCGDKFPRSFNTNTGYLHRANGVDYTAEEIKWVDDYIVASHTVSNRYDNTNCRWLVWTFGASWKNIEQLQAIEAKLGHSVALADINN